jgi:hypothetical protein
MSDVHRCPAGSDDESLDHSVVNTLSMIVHSTTCSEICYLLRKTRFFHQKSCITLSLNVPQNGPEVSLPVSRAQRTFSPGRRQRTYCCTWRGCSRLLDRNQASASEAIHLYSC